MDYTTLFPEQREAKAGSQKPAIALYEVCQQVLDGRAARGKRYELAALLVVLVLAKLAGMQSLLGASEWIQDQQERLCAHLRLPWKRMPCANTYKYVLARLDSQQVNAQFAAWLCAPRRKADAGRSRAAWPCRPEGAASTWPLMAKRSRARANRSTREKNNRSRCCMCMRSKPELS